MGKGKRNIIILIFMVLTLILIVDLQYIYQINIDNQNYLNQLDQFKQEHVQELKWYSKIVYTECGFQIQEPTKPITCNYYNLSNLSNGNLK